MKITWFGTASLMISTGTTTILSDPFIPLKDSDVKTDASVFRKCKNIIVTHGHFDHIGSLSDITDNDFSIYCTSAPGNTLLKKKIKGKINIIRPGDSFNIGDLKITAFQSRHIHIDFKLMVKTLFCRHFIKHFGSFVKNIYNYQTYTENGEILAYKIEAEGKMLFILGSLNLDSKTDYPKNADVLFLPYQGASVLKDKAKAIIEQLKPVSVFLTHYDDTFPPVSNTVNTAEIEEFIKKEYILYKPKQGETIELKE